MIQGLSLRTDLRILYNKVNFLTNFFPRLASKMAADLVRIAAPGLPIVNDLENSKDDRM